VVISQIGGGGSQQSSEGIDQFASLIQVCLVAVFAKAALHGCCAHQVHGGRGDDLNGWHLGNVANLICYVAKLLRIKIWQRVYS
jgi:hypothetical protein